MKVLHTSDWHIGKMLYGRKRYSEFEQFLNWLNEIIIREEIEILLVAGDIFDTTTPSNYAQKLYYDFLTQLKGSSSLCRHIVVIGGNHDSPSLLDAPKALLKTENIHVVGAKQDDLKDEVIPLYKNCQGKDELEALVLAVPYLRDRDLRTVAAGETVDDKQRKLVAGLTEHYAEVAKIAEGIRELEGRAQVPIIGMGHLFASGGKAGDGVRDLYVGSLAYISAAAFPPLIDYLALGHLHIPQEVGKQNHYRYSGSPIAMGFGEAEQIKQVVVMEFSSESTKPADIREIAIPCFQRLKKVRGNYEEIRCQLAELLEKNSCLDKSIWVEVEYTGKEFIANLTNDINEMTEESNIEVLSVRSPQRLIDITGRLASQLGGVGEESQSLDELDHKDVFSRVMDKRGVVEEEQKDLMNTYLEALKGYEEEDVNKV